MDTTKLLNNELLEQYIIAGSADTSVEKLRVLAEHYCDKIRLRVAENPSTPVDILRNLAYDDNQDVLIAVAANPNCHQSVIELLARSSDVIVRHGLAQSIATPRIFLERLADSLCICPHK